MASITICGPLQPPATACFSVVASSTWDISVASGSAHHQFLRNKGSKCHWTIVCASFHRQPIRVKHTSQEPARPLDNFVRQTTTLHFRWLDFDGRSQISILIGQEVVSPKCLWSSKYQRWPEQPLLQLIRLLLPHWFFQWQMPCTRAVNHGNLSQMLLLKLGFKTTLSHS